MKKLVFTIFAIIIFATNIQSEEYDIFTKDGKKHTGELVMKTDSTITIYSRHTLRNTQFFARDVIEVISKRGEYFTSENGEFIDHTVEEILDRKKQIELKRMRNPNYAIGKAFKSSGSIAVGVGVPFLALGAILYGSGVSTAKFLEKNPPTDIEITKKEAQLANNCMTAGVVLMSTGGSITILGVPLYVHGKRIMELSLQVSENGAGVAFSL